MSFWTRLFAPPIPVVEPLPLHGPPYSDSELELFVQHSQHRTDIKGIVTKDYVSALMSAMVETADELIKVHGNVDAAFYHACGEGGVLAIVVMLHQRGADPEKKFHGVTPLYMAASHGNLAIVSYLLRTCKVAIDLGEPGGVTPLIVAAMNGHEVVAFELVKFGADVNAKAANGFTPLFVANTNKHRNIERKLKLAGAWDEGSSDEWLIQVKSANMVTYLGPSGDPVIDPKLALTLPQTKALEIIDRVTHRSKGMGLAGLEHTAIRRSDVTKS